MKEERKNFRRERVVEKHAHDYVSYVDKESEVRVVKALTTLLPEAGFITEEGSATYQDEPYCWVIDPLDGTTNYIHDEAPYCVSIALRSRTELLLGVVYEVCRDECFYAWKGGKAFMNGEEIHVSNVEDTIGRFDAWMEAFLGKWDYSAAALIVQEAGGKVTDFYGEDHFIEGHHIIATNGNLHPFFQKLLAEVPPLNM